VTGHAEDALRGASIAKVINLPLAISTFEAVCTECLVSGQYGQVFNLVVARAAAVCAVVAYERAIAE
jgi:hypothetical protein